MTVILIDPGHGGINPDTGLYATSGKRSPNWPDMPQIFEGVYNRDIARRLAKLLDKNRIPYRFIVEPDEWRDISLSVRSRRANSYARKLGKTFYLAIHANAHQNPSANGLETYSYSGSTDSDNLSQLFLNKIAANVPQLRNRGAKKANFHVLRETVMPSVLVELGFMTNYQDAQYMNQNAFRNRLASGLGEALQKISGRERPDWPRKIALRGLVLLSVFSLAWIVKASTKSHS